MNRSLVREERAFVFVASVIIIPVLLLFIATGIQMQKARNRGLYNLFLTYQAALSGHHNAGHPQDALNSSVWPLLLAGFDVIAPPVTDAPVLQTFDSNGDGKKDGKFKVTYHQNTTTDDVVMIHLEQQETLLSGFLGILDPLTTSAKIGATGFQSYTSLYFDISQNVVLNPIAPSLEPDASNLFTAFNVSVDANQDLNGAVKYDALKLPFSYTGKARWTYDADAAKWVENCGVDAASAQNGTLKGRWLIKDATVDLPTNPDDPEGAAGQGWCHNPWDVWDGVTDCAPEAQDISNSTKCPSQKNALLMGLGNYWRDYKTVAQMFMQWMSEYEIETRIGVYGSATTQGDIVEESGLVMLHDAATHPYTTPLDFDTIRTRSGTGGALSCPYSFPTNINAVSGHMHMAEIRGRIDGRVGIGWPISSVTNFENDGEAHSFVHSLKNRYKPAYPWYLNNPMMPISRSPHPITAGEFPIYPVGGNTGFYLPVAGDFRDRWGIVRTYPGYYKVNSTTGLREPDPAAFPPDPPYVPPVVSSYPASIFDSIFPTEGGTDFQAAIEDAQANCAAIHNTNANAVCLNFYFIADAPGITTTGAPPCTTADYTRTYADQLAATVTALEAMEVNENAFNILIGLDDGTVTSEKSGFAANFVQTPGQGGRYLWVFKVKPLNTFRTRFQEAMESIIFWAKEQRLYTKETGS